jgi:hypothetical protein
MKFNLLRGIGGDFEINRVLGAVGTFAYIVGAHAFEAYDVIWKGNDFNVTAYCLAFPGGLGVAVASIAGAVALKDRNVAVAKATDANTAQVGAP